LTYLKSASQKQIENGKIWALDSLRLSCWRIWRKLA